jgi:hypothetical protein
MSSISCKSSKLVGKAMSGNAVMCCILTNNYSATLSFTWPMPPYTVSMQNNLYVSNIEGKGQRRADLDIQYSTFQPQVPRVQAPSVAPPRNDNGVHR